MVWTPKSGAPATFNLIATLQPLITGDTVWSWLLGFTPYMGDPIFNTASFCAEGPPAVSALDPAAFDLSDRNWAIKTLKTVALTALLIGAARDRVFSALCEQVTPASSDCVASGAAPDPGNTAWWWVHAPPGTTSIVIGAGDGGRMQDAYWAPGFHDYGFVAGTTSGASGGGDQTIVGTGHEAYEWIAFRMNANVPTYVLRCGAAGSTDSHDATAQPLPDGVALPTTRVYETIADLGAELDRQELKLDLLGSHVGYLAQQVPVLTGEAALDDPVDAVADEPIAVTDAIGAIVTLASTPPWASEDHGTPPQLHRVGRVTIGTDAAWFPSYLIEHSPLLIAFPKGTTRIQVNTHPPVSATVVLLRPPK